MSGFPNYQISKRIQVRIFAILFVGLLFPNICCLSQTNKLSGLETKISLMFDSLSSNDADREKIRISESIVTLFEEALQTEGSFVHSFDTLKHIGQLVSPDGKLKIYTWNIPYSNGTHEYFGFIHIYDKDNGYRKIYRLHDNSDSIAESEFVELTPQKWFGALYYEILVNKTKEKTFYTLLGFDFNDFFTSKKLIEVLSFKNDTVPVFGASIFNTGNPGIKRMVFEYSSRAVMNLKYDARHDMIILDHLSPSRPSYEGKYRFYGPDMSFDALKWNNGMWNLISDIDITNPTK